MTVREFCVGGDGCSSRREFPGNVKKPKKASTPSASSLQPPAEVGIITSSSSVKKSMPSESKETMKKDNDISGIPRNVMEALATKSIPSLAGSLSARLGVDLSVAPAASPKTKKKKKKKGSSSSAAAVVPSVSKTSDSTHGTGGHQPHHHSHHNNHLDAAVFHGQRNSGKNEEDIWFHSDAAEKQRIREFWLHLSEDDRRALVKLEKEAVLKKMKEQQRTSCSCDICGRKK